MRRHTLPTILLALLCIAGAARKTTIKLKVPPERTATADAPETLTPDSIGKTSWPGDSIVLAGYDKKATSAIESLFVTNNSGADVERMTIRLTYYDMRGRQLHSREATTDTRVPRGETRKIDIPSWDRQKSFYYHKSGTPRKAATPFDVTTTIVELVIVR